MNLDNALTMLHEPGHGIVLRTRDDYRRPDLESAVAIRGFAWSDTAHAYVLPRDLTDRAQGNRAARLVRDIEPHVARFHVDPDLHHLPLGAPLMGFDVGLTLYATAAAIELRPRPRHQAAVINELRDEFGALDGVRSVVASLRKRSEDHPGPARAAIQDALRTAEEHLAHVDDSLGTAASLLTAWKPRRKTAAKSARISEPGR
ncbi:hypothetical protein [Streptomyces sp. SID3343]|uniref:hypothetical protein n=1 Tax=Streptomyces sp. SID3343 TaxID=2690260 RepID=UPI00136C74C5|nr:hypothetical protein [Streptomyces sp. SID3343]MYV98756.1 hypothetical protein [Streptomyces sp. SID3343]